MEPRDPAGGSKRTLAAIVFTDIVGFSARMQEDEEATLDLARRDLDLIRQVCSSNGGRVLKGTGDGLLLYFDSAVDAVGCAVKAQNELAARAQDLPPDAFLLHRIGIHLGDVFLSEDDVMGDGVNIAARLQSEAPPGGICISQTVYDVVKNRLHLRVTPLGPRELKNIREAIPVYQVLLDAVLQERPSAGAARRRLWWAAAAALVVAVSVVLAWGLSSRSSREKTAASPQPHSAAAAHASAPVTPAPDGPATAPEARPKPPPPGLPVAGEASSPPDDGLDEARRLYLPAKRFDAMLSAIEESDLAGLPIAGAYRQLLQLDGRARERLAGTSESDPLVVRDPRGRTTRIWAEGEVAMVQEEGPATRTSLEEMPLALYIGMLSASSTTPRERQAARFLGAECRRAGLLEER